MTRPGNREGESTKTEIGPDRLHRLSRSGRGPNEHNGALETVKVVVRRQELKKQPW